MHVNSSMAPANMLSTFWSPHSAAYAVAASDEQDPASHSGSCNVDYVRPLWGTVAAQPCRLLTQHLIWRECVLSLAATHGDRLACVLASFLIPPFQQRPINFSLPPLSPSNTPNLHPFPSSTRLAPHSLSPSRPCSIDSDLICHSVAAGCLAGPTAPVAQRRRLNAAHRKHTGCIVLLMRPYILVTREDACATVCALLMARGRGVVSVSPRPGLPTHTIAPLLFWGFFCAPAS